MTRRLVALLASLALPAVADATVTVTPIDTTTGGQIGSTTDAFDVSQGTVVTGTSGYNNATLPQNALGAISATAEPQSLIFADGTQQLQTLSFKTVAPVTLYGFNLYLGQDGTSNGDVRGFDTVALYGSTDGITYTDLASIDLANPYEGYGGISLLVAATFAPVTYQYFRFEGTPFDNGGFSEAFSGGRILELDAVTDAPAAAVPEPASWAMFIGGFGLVGGALRGRRRVAVAFA